MTRLKAAKFLLGWFSLVPVGALAAQFSIVVIPDT